MVADEQMGVIILAAGAGRRLGRDKATLPWGGTTLVGHVVAQFPPERVARCVVVAHPANRAAVREAVGPGVEIVVNPDPRAEMIASVRIGLEGLGGLGGALCIHPVDVFAISPELVVLLHEAWGAERGRIHLPEVKGQGAHPVVIPVELAGVIGAIPAGRGLNWLLREHAGVVARHAWPDERLLADLDTPEDYARHRPA